MIKVSVLYPNSEGVQFNMDYYLQNYIPMIKKLLGPACRELSVDKGLAGVAPGVPAAYTTIAHLCFDSVESFAAAYNPHAAAIIADVPNYTNVEPLVQISQVL